MQQVDLYGEENPILIGLTAEHDLCDPADEDAVVVVAGHHIYVGSPEEANRSIRAEYLRRNNIADPLDGR